MAKNPGAKVPRAGKANRQTVRPQAKAIALALQGGGSHGAFTWGALDRLLDDDRVHIEAISATSAGAMNAAVMAYGYSIGGKTAAKEKLESFWKAISDANAFMSLARYSPVERWLREAGLPNDFTPAAFAMHSMTQLFSPYQLNPWNYNPLRDALLKAIDFKQLCSCPVTTRLYISATNVRSGKIKVFENSELSADAVLASACLPHLFQAVEIGGEHYWDGGFMGNPAIFPLIYREGTRDVVIVHINPLERAKLPKTAPEIMDRVNEISFNSSLMREMRAIAFVTRLIDEGSLSSDRYSRVLIHSIRDDDEMGGLGVSSKLDTDWAFLCGLRDLGRKRADEWLEQHASDVGTRSSIDVRQVYL